MTIALVGWAGIADSRDNVEDEAARFAAQFSDELAESLRGNAEFNEALAQNSGCAHEIAVMIIAQAALDQAQAEFDIAYLALEECINGMDLPSPPGSGPDPPAFGLTDNGEVSVLNR